MIEQQTKAGNWGGDASDFEVANPDVSDLSSEILVPVGRWCDARIPADESAFRKGTAGAVAVLQSDYGIRTKPELKSIIQEFTAMWETETAGFRTADAE